jgi:putative copper resistance protein D
MPVWLFFLGFAAFPLQSVPQDHSMHQGHHADASPVDTTIDPGNTVKLLADKAESEFNHHLAGLFVVLGGLFILTQGAFTGRWPWTRYIWPSTFLLSGLFVLVWSDTELWPFGDRHWLEALQNNREVLQHKTFALLLLALACIEALRAKGELNKVWSGLVFPILAVGGSILLLFHQHEAGMHGPGHMETMGRIQSEHLEYAVMGIGLGLAKALAEIKTRAQTLFATLWPLLMVGLGVLLMFYRE